MSHHYMIRRNKIYYFRQRVPNDLEHLFPVKVIIRSLKTRDLTAAKLLMHSVQGKLETAFALLRTGFLDEEQTRTVVEALTSDDRKARRPSKEKRPHGQPLLSKIIKLYIQEHQPFWTKKTHMEYVCQFDILLRLLGDKGISGYSREECIYCRDTLMILPPNFNKRGKYKDKSMSVIMNMPPAPQPMHPVTVNGYMVLLSSLFKWAVRQGYSPRNPAEGLNVRFRHRADQERKPYSHEDLQLIVDNLPRTPKNPDRYWIPLVALYSGMRLDEICQMTVDDLAEIDGIVCFDVNDDGEKKLKTPASHRKIPVHPMLIKLGFMDYVAKQRKKKARQLWSNLEQDRFGSWGSMYSKWFTRFNRGFISKDPKKCFHSFRHNLADSLKQLEVSDTLIAEILGHVNENVSTGRYGKPFHPDRLFAALEKVDYGLKFPETPLAI